MKISFMASHGGSAARYIIKNLCSKSDEIQVGCVVTNNENSSIRNWATSEGYRVRYISSKTHEDDELKDLAIERSLKEAETDLIVLSGYMKKLGSNVLSTYSGKILNVHPSLLPKFGGKGMFGDRVHEAVLKSKMTKSGATVHVVTAEYDEGPILSQGNVDISANETIDSLRIKVQSIEGPLFIKAIGQFITKSCSSGPKTPR